MTSYLRPYMDTTRAVPKNSSDLIYVHSMFELLYVKRIYVFGVGINDRHFARIDFCGNVKTLDDRLMALWSGYSSLAFLILSFLLILTFFLISFFFSKRYFLENLRFLLLLLVSFPYTHFPFLFSLLFTFDVIFCYFYLTFDVLPDFLLFSSIKCS